MVKLGEFCGFSVTLKCQLPDGDLETLISIKSDEELANLIEEYDRFSSSNSSSSPKIRAILSPPKSLKKVSPPPSVVDYGSPKSVFAGLDSYPNRYVSRSCSPRHGIPVGHRRSLEKACLYPCHVQGGPYRISYNHHHHHHQVSSGCNYVCQWHLGILQDLGSFIQ